MAAKEEDFSFPATATDSPPRSLDSPPLWRPDKSKGKKAEAEAERVFEFREVIRSSSSDCKERNCGDGDGGEEKMDLLWEDLNEDQFARNCEKFAQSSENNIKGLKLSKRNGRMVSGKKPSILVFVKILKKVFLMHNSQLAMKKKKPSSW